MKRHTISVCIGGNMKGVSVREPLEKARKWRDFIRNKILEDCIQNPRKYLGEN